MYSVTTSGASVDLSSEAAEANMGELSFIWLFTLVINELLGFFIVGLLSYIFPSNQTSNYYCNLYFSPELLYTSCIPGFICFFISIAVIIYMSAIYIKCRIAKLNNSVHPHNPSPSFTNIELQQQGTLISIYQTWKWCSILNIFRYFTLGITFSFNQWI